MMAPHDLKLAAECVRYTATQTPLQHHAEALRSLARKLDDARERWAPRQKGPLT